MIHATNSTPHTSTKRDSKRETILHVNKKDYWSQCNGARCKTWRECSFFNCDFPTIISFIKWKKVQHHTYIRHAYRTASENFAPFRGLLYQCKTTSLPLRVSQQDAQAIRTQNNIYTHKPKFHLVRHVTTRHNTLSIAHAFWQQEKVVTCCVALVLQHGATRSSRQVQLARHVFQGVATAWTRMDMSTSLFPEVFPETDGYPEHKRLNFLTRALLLLRRPPCWNKHGATCTSATRSSRRDWHIARDATSVIRATVEIKTSIQWNTYTRTTL